MPFKARAGAAGVLAVLFASVALAMSASAGAANPTSNSSGGICRIEGIRGTGAAGASVAARASVVAHGSSIGGTLGKFVAEKAVGVVIERYAVIGMSGLLRMIDSDAITPDSTEQAILKQLNTIYMRIGEVEARVERVGDRVNQLIGERREDAFDRELNALCDIASNQMGAYRRYRTAVKAGVELGHLLEGPDYAQADVPTGLRQMTPREKVADDIASFQRIYENQSPEAQFTRLRRDLIPDPAQPNPAPLLTLFGKVLMSRDRFLTRPDSGRLRDLYREFAEIRALASWMGAEYWASLDNLEEEGAVWDSFLRNTKEAEAALPRLIPPGAVLDVGTEGQDTARRRPLWYTPDVRGLAWLPPNDVGAAKPLSIDEVGEDLRYTESLAELGKGWHAPDRQEFLALIHKGCSADPDHPTRPLVGCSQAVPGNANLAAYLQRINPARNWQLNFCQSTAELKCPDDAGPNVAGKSRAFIWTSDRHSQRLVCGRRNFGLFNNKEVDRRFWTYAGFLTVGPIRQQIFPHLPQKTPTQRTVPGKDLSKIAYVQEECNNWFRHRVTSDPAKGILLATRYTNAENINPVSKLDLMAQFPK